MAASIAIVPASGSVIAKVSACRVTVTNAPSNDASSFDDEAVPTMDPITYRLVASCDDVDNLVSHEFTPSSDTGVDPKGGHVWDNVIFPVDGSWTIDLVDQADDSVAATLAVTVTE